MRPLDSYTLRAIRDATPAQLAAADALIEELDLLVLPPPRPWELWAKMVDALLREVEAAKRTGGVA